MATIQERQGQRAIDHQCEALMIIEELLQVRTLRRNPAYRQPIRRIRRHLLEANAAVCRSLFRGDTLTDLPPEQAA